MFPGATPQETIIEGFKGLKARSIKKFKTLPAFSPAD
jgi:hypothetical protein